MPTSEIPTELLKEILRKLERLIDSVEAPPSSATDPGGLKSRMATLERSRTELETRVHELERLVREIAESPGRAALAGWRQAAIMIGAAIIGIAAGAIGATHR